MNKSVGFIGLGQMATALAAAFVGKDLVAADHIWGYDPLEGARQQFGRRVGAVRLVSEPGEVVRQAEVVFLAVKPQVMGTVTAAIGPELNPERLVVSVAAGVTLDYLTDRLGTSRVIRVMPNTPCTIGLGASAFAMAAGATDDDAERVESLLSAVGLAFRVPERLLDAVTGLSGSGPAYVYTMIEALSDGGVLMGLPRETALALAAQTVRGTAEMMLAEKSHPATLRDRVTSPGGTTIAGLQVLEERNFRGTVIAAVEAASLRAHQLGQEYDTRSR